MKKDNDDGNEYPYPIITPAEYERLALLMEECGEIIQVIGKILRHGYGSYHPDNQEQDNRELLEKELGDVMFAIKLMKKKKDIDGIVIKSYMNEKEENISDYLHFN
jgi:NTP pyrophosphatase (non-canonical NTP hydrolase)